ncbi:FAS1-like dehydratase domain-containing protein, partial [Paracoccus sanguinis]|uniref:FAS1-like dehydratase domain-containing protein n=1 Tax=Paracoccus sanguinis TaxID=1545044 RepID=UPI00068D4A10
MTRLTDWIGRTETATETLRPFPADALAATLDRDERYPEGTALPDLWHWLYFLPLHRLSESGRDGHAARGGFLPPVPLPRRMWAGSRFRFHAPLRVGVQALRRSTILKVEEKQGRSGPLCFVTVGHELIDGDTLCIAEELVLLYDSSLFSDDDPSETVTDVRPTSIVELPVEWIRDAASYFSMNRFGGTRPYTPPPAV